MIQVDGVPVVLYSRYLVEAIPGRYSLAKSGKCMPGQYKILPAHELIVTIFSGLVTPDDFLGTYSSLRADALFRTEQREISDYSGIQRACFGFAEISALAHHVGARYKDANLVTALVAQSEIAYGLARTYQAFAGTSPTETVRIFRSRRGALDWLGLHDVSDEILDFGPGTDCVCSDET